MAGGDPLPGVVFSFPALSAPLAASVLYLRWDERSQGRFEMYFFVAAQRAVYPRRPRFNNVSLGRFLNKLENSHVCETIAC